MSKFFQKIFVGVILATFILVGINPANALDIKKKITKKIENNLPEFKAAKAKQKKETEKAENLRKKQEDLKKQRQIETDAKIKEVLKKRTEKIKKNAEGSSKSTQP